VTLLHARQVSQHWADGVDYIEDMLRKQLIAAIGKEVRSALVLLACALHVFCCAAMRAC
jgi:hypothetical protein